MPLCDALSGAAAAFRGCAMITLSAAADFSPLLPLILRCCHYAIDISSFSLMAMSLILPPDYAMLRYDRDAMLLMVDYFLR